MEYTHNTHTQAYNIGVHSKKNRKQKARKKNKKPYFYHYIFVYTKWQAEKEIEQTDGRTQNNGLKHSLIRRRKEEEKEKLKREKKNHTENRNNRPPKAWEKFQ